MTKHRQPGPTTTFSDDTTTPTTAVRLPSLTAIIQPLPNLVSSDDTTPSPATTIAYDHAKDLTKERLAISELLEIPIIFLVNLQLTFSKETPKGPSSSSSMRLHYFDKHKSLPLIA
ncbi:hypothetical protein L2E82_17818 [Cichorium intybus]|uniref:Uncharacterized protein n=1 Tax=Cichorium intybus TaxID=13427 RepID=A0ACB9F8X0_CICIN|nr:hypothetical protein L2E82_17818 [Cichorium intybus]